MRMDKGAILASMVVIALASVFAGAGTVAYFTDVETANVGPIQAGTLDMKISKTYTGGYGDIPIDLGSISGLGPGEEFTLEVWLYNDGNLDAEYVFLRFCELSESVEGFAKQLKLVSLDDWSTSTGSWYEGPFSEEEADIWLNYWYGTPGADRKGYITLWDLVHVANEGGTSKLTGLYFYTEGAPELPAGGKCGARITFELMWETKNEYQGAEVSFRIDFIGSQDMTDLDDYITETLGALTG